MPRILVPVRQAVTEEAILAYAALTGDRNPIHVDAAFAAATPMGGRIAHGTMSLNLLWQSVVATLGEDAAFGLELDIRFVAPVRIGDVVEAGGEALPDGTVWNVRVRNQRGEDVITGTLGPAT